MTKKDVTTVAAFVIAAAACGIRLPLSGNVPVTGDGAHAPVSLKQAVHSAMNAYRDSDGEALAVINAKLGADIISGAGGDSFPVRLLNPPGEADQTVRVYGRNLYSSGDSKNSPGHPVFGVKNEGGDWVGFFSTNGDDKTYTVQSCLERVDACGNAPGTKPALATLKR